MEERWDKQICKIYFIISGTDNMEQCSSVNMIVRCLVRYCMVHEIMNGQITESLIKSEDYLCIPQDKSK